MEITLKSLKDNISQTADKIRTSELFIRLHF